MIFEHNRGRAAAFDFPPSAFDHMLPGEPTANFPPALKNDEQTKYDPFPATRWSLVSAAGSDDELKAGRAIGELCETYWFPIYSFIRNKGNAPHNAEDLTQSFFQSILQRNSLAGTKESRGKLRSYLLAAVKKFLVDAHRKESSQRRGGDFIPLDFSSAEALYAMSEQTASSRPEDVSHFDREWAKIIIARVIGNLRMAIADPQREAQFDALEPYLTGIAGDPPYKDLAKKFSMKSATLRVTMTRIRKRFRNALEEEIADTLANEDELREEAVYLLAAYVGERGQL